MKKNLKQIIIIFMISLALIVVSEASLQFIFPEKSSLFKNNELAYEFNKDYLVSLRANIEKVFVRSIGNGGDIIRWSTNSNAFRGSELKRNPEFRVIVYGDSNIQARFSRDEKTFVFQLEQYLSRINVNELEVINAGIVGFGPDQSFIKMVKEADIYKPNLVIFHIFADNDFGDLIRNRLFELDVNDNLIKFHHRTEIDPLLRDGQQGFIDIISSLLVIKATKRLFKSLVMKLKKTDTLGREKIKILEKRNEEEYLIYKNSKPKKFSHFADHYDIDVATAPESESSVVKTKLMEAVLKQVNAFAHSKGIELIVLIQPSIVDLTQNQSFSYKQLQKYSLVYKRTNLTNIVEDICIRNQISFLNLFHVFENNNPSNLFFKINDGHWNDEGQALAAREIALYIAQHQMLTPSVDKDSF